LVLVSDIVSVFVSIGYSLCGYSLVNRFVEFSGLVRYVAFPVRFGQGLCGYSLGRRCVWWFGYVAFTGRCCAVGVVIL
jgi:hypothetical protein